MNRVTDIKSHIFEEILILWEHVNIMSGEKSRPRNMIPKTIPIMEHVHV